MTRKSARVYRLKEQYTKQEKFEGEYYVWLKVGAQHFCLAHKPTSKIGSDWYRTQLASALDTLLTKEGVV
jgi:hypothetical protein